MAADWRGTPAFQVDMPSTRHLHEFPGLENDHSPGTCSTAASRSCEERWNYRQQDLEMGTFSFLSPLLEVSRMSLNYEHDCDLYSEMVNWSHLPYKNPSETGSLFLCLSLNKLSQGIRLAKYRSQLSWSHEPNTKFRQESIFM